MFRESKITNASHLAGWNAEGAMFQHGIAGLPAQRGGEGPALPHGTPGTYLDVPTWPEGT